LYSGAPKRFNHELAREPARIGPCAREGRAAERYNGRPTRGLRTRGRSTAIDIFSLFVVQGLFPDLPPQGIAVLLALLVLSLGIHEAAHAWVALQCGDPTGRDLGRITFNPVPHIDPFLTILLPLILLLSKTGLFFGGAKPVPVDYHRLRHPLRDMALVALAGPLSNFLLAIFFYLALKLLVVELGVWNPDMLGPRILLGAVEFNLLLAAFNLLPIAPLDGSRVMTWLLPAGLREAYRGTERFGFPLLLLLVWFVPPVGRLINETMYTLYDWVVAIVTLGGLW